MDEAKLRAWWAARQGLDGSLAGLGCAEILARTGWARSVGGAAPYLTFFARGGVSRQTVDDAAARQEIHELPSARGCTYIVPAADFALALKAGQGFSDEAQMRVARKLGVTDKEVDRLRAVLLKALKGGPLGTDELRTAAGGAVRNLGEEGVRRGMTSTLPLALGFLQTAGEIRRIPTNGRLDQQRYKYALWQPGPLAKSKLSGEEAYTELARRFFQWIGPATPAEFQWFSGLGVKAAKAAIGPLGLVPLEEGDARLLFTQDLERLHAFRAPKKPHYALASSLDGMAHLRRNLRELIAQEDLKRPLFSDKRFLEAGSISDLPSHAIFDRGRLIGLWEFDVEGGCIAWMSFIPANKGLKKAVGRMEDFVRNDLGDARSFSLDSPKSRAPRVAALRKIASSLIIPGQAAPGAIR